MALNDARADPPAFTNGGRHSRSCGSVHSSPKSETTVCNGKDPLTAASSGDSVTTDNDDDSSGIDKTSENPHKPNKPKKNGSVVKQNGLLKHISSPKSQQALPLQPRGVCCKQCHYPSVLPLCQCGQPDCPLFNTLPVPCVRAGSSQTCPCCAPPCSYPPQFPPTLCTQQRHHQQQRWQEHLHRHAHGPNLR
ncbi:unnamed protein product [Knipowitschia caucasica]